MARKRATSAATKRRDTKEPDARFSALARLLARHAVRQDVAAKLENDDAAEYPENAPLGDAS